MLFSVAVPGFGEVQVDADRVGSARLGASQFASRIGLPESDVTTVGTAFPLAERNPEILLLDASGGVIAAETPTRQATNLDSAPASRNATFRFIGKVVNSSGAITFHRIQTADTARAREILEARFGPGATVQVVSTPEFLLENDSDFATSFQASGTATLDAFVDTIGVVTAPESRPGDTGDGEGDDDQAGSDDNSGSGGNQDEPVGKLPVDVQAFPFASFQNAVRELGLDPEGVLGSTVSDRFNALAPGARIGSLTGTIDPIGQDPGALQGFFRDRFADLDLAAETFTDLLAGQAPGELDSERLLAFAALQSPDVATSQGQGAAADVFRLARAAAANRFGPFVASRLLPSNARLFRELESQLAQADTSTDFLQFAREQNLLPI